MSIPIELSSLLDKFNSLGQWKHMERQKKFSTPGKELTYNVLINAMETISKSNQAGTMWAKQTTSSNFYGSDDAFISMLKMRLYSTSETVEEFRAKWLRKAVEFFKQNKLEFSRLCFNSIDHVLGQ